MKLDPNCVRDILIAVEENTGYSVEFVYPTQLDKAPALAKYEKDVVRYHIQQCEMNGLIIILERDYSGTFHILDLTPKGHEFLANIRSDNIWADVKTISSKVGSASLSTLIQIATSVITANPEMASPSSFPLTLKLLFSASNSILFSSYGASLYTGLPSMLIFSLLPGLPHQYRVAIPGRCSRVSLAAFRQCVL